MAANWQATDKFDKRKNVIGQWMLHKISVDMNERMSEGAKLQVFMLSEGICLDKWSETFPLIYSL